MEPDGPCARVQHDGVQKIPPSRRRPSAARGGQRTLLARPGPASARAARRRRCEPGRPPIAFLRTRGSVPGDHPEAAPSRPPVAIPMTFHEPDLVAILRLSRDDNLMRVVGEEAPLHQAKSQHSALHEAFGRPPPPQSVARVNALRSITANGGSEVAQRRPVARSRSRASRHLATGTGQAALSAAGRTAT